MGALIANTGYTLLFTPAVPATIGDEAITTPPSAKVKCDGAPAYSGPLTVNATFSPPPGMDTPPTLPLVFTIPPGSTKVKIEGKPASLEGDESAPVPWSFSNAASGATAAGTMTVKIVKAGNTKVTAS
jgi:uncharacterized Zn-binding protein involved in type VI secretion